MEHRFTLEDYQGLRFRLDFYETDIIATTFGRTALSYRVDEKEVIGAFSDQRFSMILPRNTLLVRQRGALKSISVFIPAAEYALFVDYGEANLAQFNMPLPSLLCSLAWRKRHIEGIDILALKTKDWPTPDDRLYAAPLPNVSAQTGRVCLGQIRFDPARLPDDVHAIYQVVMASPFSNHDVGHKSKEFLENVFYRWHALHEKRAAEYPLDDLVETGWTVATYLNGTRDLENDFAGAPGHAARDAV
jgi:hypothetical protein